MYTLFIRIATCFWLFLLTYLLQIASYYACFIFKAIIKCDWILGKSSKSDMKSGVFLHVFKDISIYA